MSAVGQFPSAAEASGPVRIVDGAKVVFLGEGFEEPARGQIAGDADVVIVGASRASLKGDHLANVESVLRPGGLVVVFLGQGGDADMPGRSREALLSVRSGLTNVGLGAQRLLTRLHQPRRPSLTVDDAFLQTYAAASPISWLLSRAIGDTPPSADNSTRIVCAAADASALEAMLGQGVAWITEIPGAVPTWMRSRQLLSVGGEWTLQSMGGAPPTFNGPLALTDVVSPIPPGLNGENVLGHVLISSGLDGRVTHERLRQWAEAARMVLRKDGPALVPFDVQPRNFVVGARGWHFVDNGLASRFQYPLDVFLLRSLAWLLLLRVLRHEDTVPGVPRRSPRDTLDRLMTRIGSSASDVIVDLWLQFEADLEARTALKPRPRDDVLAELRALLDGPPSAVDVEVQLKADSGPGVAQVSGRSPSAGTGWRRLTGAVRRPSRCSVASAPAANPLFDADWYRSQYADVRDQAGDPYEHYRRQGWREGRNPNRFFETNWYLARYPDVRASGMDPLDHYMQVGAGDGRNPGPSFDGTTYLSQNPDVLQSGMNPLLHYLRHGAAEGRVITPVERSRPASAAPHSESPDGLLASELVDVLDAEYGIAAARVVRRPGGEGSAAYEAVDGDGAEWFVKVSAPADLCWDVPDRDQSLLASRELSTRVASGLVVAPSLRRSGQPTLTRQGRVIAVFPQVELDSIGGCSEWSDDTLRAVAAFVGDIHRESLALSPGALGSRWPPGFGRLDSLLQQLETHVAQEDATACQRIAASIVLPHGDELMQLVREYDRLRGQVLTLKQPRVLCHTDLNPLNLRRDSEGGLVLIDCEDMTWANPECDLYFLLDLPRASVAIEAYQRARGQRCDLRAEPFEVGFYVDALGLFHLILCRLLGPPMDPADEARYIADLQRCVVTNMEGRFHDMLEPSMVTIREALRAS